MDNIDITVINHEPVVLSPDDCIKLLYHIDLLISEICTEKNYDINNIKPTHWNYIIHQIGIKLFSVHPELTRQYNKAQNTYNNGNLLVDNLDLLFDYVYSPLCDSYNQIKGIVPFSRMLNLSYNAINDWDRRDKVTSSNTSLRKKIITASEESLVNAMLSSNQNPVKFIAIGNHKYGWSEQNREYIPEQKTVISLDDIPQLELSDNSQLPFFDDTE